MRKAGGRAGGREGGGGGEGGGSDFCDRILLDHVCAPGSGMKWEGGFGHDPCCGSDPSAGCSEV